MRAVLFDKSNEANWSLTWHQDRTICVEQRMEVEGFGPWTRKGGMDHVAPPFDVLSRMATLRVHLDDVPATNAPLLIAPGSHRDGRVSEAARSGGATARHRDPLGHCRICLGLFDANITRVWRRYGASETTCSPSRFRLSTFAGRFEVACRFSVSFQGQRMITAMTETLPGLDVARNLTVWGPFRQHCCR